MATYKEVKDIEKLQKRTIKFPEFESFHDIFTDVRNYNYSPGNYAKHLAEHPSWDSVNDAGVKKNYSVFWVGGYLVVSGKNRRDSMEVLKVSQPILDYAATSILHVPNDTTHFEVNIWGDSGRALVTIKHGQIIGSHWLAIIDASTIPTFNDYKVSTEYRKGKNSFRWSHPVTVNAYSEDKAIEQAKALLPREYRTRNSSVELVTVGEDE